jgi:hypothetical protein
VAAGDIFRLAVQGAYSGQEIVVTHDFRQVVAPSVPSGTPETDLIDAWQTACQTAYLAIVTATFTLQTVTAQQVCGPTKPYRGKVFESVNLPGNGSGSAPAAPWLATLCRESTAFAGRSYAGRFFIPVLDESYFASTALSAGFNTSVSNYCAALANAFKQNGTNNEWDLVVFSRKLNNGEAGHCASDAATVLTVTNSGILTTMRSRRSRTGA